MLVAYSNNSPPMIKLITKNSKFNKCIQKHMKLFISANISINLLPKGENVSCVDRDKYSKKEEVKVIS